MKKHLLFLLAICTVALMTVSCNRENGGGGNTGSNIKVQYKMLESYNLAGEIVQISPGFHYNIKYVDATGKTVEVNNVTAPWVLPAFEVKSPFTAIIEGTIVFNENELPDGPIHFGAAPKICVLKSGDQVIYDNDVTGYFNTKEKFLEYAASHPEKMSFKVERTIQ
jgi:hypothetical protein